MRASNPTLCIMLTLVGLSSFQAQAADDEQPVNILQKWNGKVKDNGLKKLEPAAGFIVDQDAWNKVFKAWRPNEAVPEIDFKKQMVLVFTADGPNSVGCGPTHDGKGNIKAVAMSTMMAGPGFGYLMQCIAREGVKTVNGKPVPQ